MQSPLRLRQLQLLRLGWRHFQRDRIDERGLALAAALHLLPAGENPHFLENDLGDLPGPFQLRLHNRDDVDVGPGGDESSHAARLIDPYRDGPHPRGGHAGDPRLGSHPGEVSTENRHPRRDLRDGHAPQHLRLLNHRLLGQQFPRVLGDSDVLGLDARARSNVDSRGDHSLLLPNTGLVEAVFEVELRRIDGDESKKDRSSQRQ